MQTLVYPVVQYSRCLTLQEIETWPKWSVADDEKFPVNAKTGKRIQGAFGSDERNAQLVSYNEAKALARSYGYRFVGLHIEQGMGLVGVDGDGILDDEGRCINPLWRWFLTQWSSYLETSTRGHGLHGLAFGQLPDNKNRAFKPLGFELFVNHFLIITETRYEQYYTTDITEQQQTLDDLLAILAMKGKQQGKPSQNCGDSTTHESPETGPGSPALSSRGGMAPSFLWVDRVGHSE